MKRTDDIIPLIKDGNDIFLSLPFLVKGKLEYPPQYEPDTIRSAFDDASINGQQSSGVKYYAKVAGAQVLREPIATQKQDASGDAFSYQVMPEVDPVRMGYYRPSSLADDLYNLPFAEVLQFLDRLSKALSSDGPLIDYFREIAAISSSLPSHFFDAAYRGFGMVLNPTTAALMADKGLSFLGHQGREFLDDWVDVSLPIGSGPAMLTANKVFGSNTSNTHIDGLKLRAMPTRQLHITAGNAPGIPFVSAARAFTTKSASLIKMPQGVTIPGALLGYAMVEASADHPLTKHTSIVYWPGGDRETESVFYQQDFFDRIVVWGAPEAVTSVKSQSLFTKVLTFNPRYGMSFIGKETFPDDIESAAVKASTDTMIWNQKACIASLVHYVEGSEQDALKYCEVLAEVMKKWDNEIPNFTPAMVAGHIRRMRRGKLAGAKWFYHQDNGHFQSAVVYAPGEFDMMDHPMWRLVVVRRVDKLTDCLKYLSSSVSTVGIYPERRRLELRDRVAACGVSNVVELGQSERLIPGAPHDGSMVFAELVDWKNA